LKKARWLDERLSELLPVNYFHVVFTIDHLVNPLALWNGVIIYNLLFSTASAILKAYGKRYLGGEMGFMAVLHTWGQDLGFHMHLHVIVAGGALSKDRSRWRSSPKDFLFPIVELSADFRDAFCKGLNALYRKGELLLSGVVNERLKDPLQWEAMLSEMTGKKWEVYAKEPFGGPEKVLDYMGRYVHRVAISNHRLISVQEGRVRFSYRDNREGGKLKEMNLAAEEFIGRFLQHVLPGGLMRIRYYGFLQGGQREEKLKRIRELLGDHSEKPRSIKETIEALYERLTGVNPCICPICSKGRMVRRPELKPSQFREIKSMEDLIAFGKAA
jgi:hypothetical protein